MSENTTARPADTGGAGTQDHPEGEAVTRFDLDDCFAVGGARVALPLPRPGDYGPLPVTWEGHEYSIKRAFTGSQVRTFFKLLRRTGDDTTKLVLHHILTGGAAGQLAADMAELSVTEYDHLLGCLYKICGLMSAEGKFLRA